MPSSDRWPQLDGLDSLEWAFVEARLMARTGSGVLRSLDTRFVIIFEWPF